MKKLIIAVLLLLAVTAGATALVLAQVRMDPFTVAGVFGATALVLGAFLSLTEGAVVRVLRHWASRSVGWAITLPLLLLVPYLIYAAGTRYFSALALLKLAVYVVAPAAILAPDLHHRRETANLRDFLAMIALAVPIPTHWLSDIWTKPVDLYFFLPLISVCTGYYAFGIVRQLEGIGYSLFWRKADLGAGLANWVGFSILGIPLGYALSFIHFHWHGVSGFDFAFNFVGIYLTIAIPEEMFFRGILQNLLEKTITAGPRGRYALVLASVIFGLSHFHHPPVPNWRYCIMATLAGLFYGTAFRMRRRIAASALTHALVDTIWHFWF